MSKEHFSSLMTSGNIMPIKFVNWGIGYKYFNQGKAGTRYQNRDVLGFFRYHDLVEFDSLIMFVKRSTQSTMLTQLRLRLKELGAI